ncbi:MAG: YoaK family protein [Lachnospiraceae bacterium]|nr:YoaK family protein [Lachnospiraceae bacterium]
MHNQNETDVILHYIMSLVGGFLGTYALLLRGGNFGSAQTGNFLEAMISLSERDFAGLAIRTGGAVIYALALVFSYILTNCTNVNMRTMVLKVEAVGLLITALIPVTADPILALYPIFALMSFQWGTYSGAKGYNSASIFTTNNFKQCVLGWTQYFLQHDQKAKEKACLYTFTVLSFLSGAFLGCISVYRFGTYAAFVCYIPLFTARMVLLRNQKNQKRIFEKAGSYQANQ